MRLQSQIVIDEGEVMEVPGAHNDRIHFFAAAVLEVNGAVLNFRQQWMLLHRLRPFEAHGRRAIAHRH